MRQPKGSTGFLTLLILLTVAMGTAGAWGQLDQLNQLPPEQDQGPDHGKPQTLVGWLRLSGPLYDGSAEFSLGGGSPGPSLRSVVAQLATVADDERYRGLVIHLDEPVLSFAQVHELDRAVAGIRASGKKTLVFAEHYDLMTYALACSADEILLQNKGQLELAGMAIEEVYLLGLLEKVGLKADFIQVGQFKGADEQLTRRGPSEAWNQNFDAVLDDLYGQIVRRIAEARKLTPAQVEQAMADSWGLTDQQLVERKLVDQVVSRDLADVTSRAFGNTFRWDEGMGLRRAATLQADNPLALLRTLFQPPNNGPTRPSIALVHITGPITGGDSSPGGMFGSPSTGSRSVLRAITQAREQNLIKGVVLRIDSPGGSALASDIIWQAVDDLAREKPVFVSIGSLAASGGYYIASAGDAIYVTPGAILGSIGVVGGKVILGGLYEKLGVTVHRRSRGPLGDMFNSVEPFSPEQRAALQLAFNRTYELFLERVQEGRGERLVRIEDVAQGRLFTGRQAVANGLADQIGGIDAVIAELAREAQLQPGEFDVIHLPPPMTFPEFLQAMMSPLALAATSPEQRAVLQMARQLMGPRAWSATAAVLEGMMLLRDEPALTLMPAPVIIR